MCNANIMFRFQSFLYFKVLYAGLKNQNLQNRFDVCFRLTGTTGTKMYQAEMNIEYLMLNAHYNSKQQ